MCSTKKYHKEQMLKYSLIKFVDNDEHHKLSIKQHVTIYIGELLPGSGLGSSTSN